MARFRLFTHSVLSVSQPRAIVHALLAEMIRPAHFYLGPELVLRWEYVAEQQLSWELFQGRLLDPAHTRWRRTFAAWKVYTIAPESEEPPDEPLLALYLDEAAGQIHLVRGLDSYVWEGYDAGGNVYLSRERRKWVRELVATLAFDRFAEGEQLRDELTCALFQAVVGTSRLPLSSVETPLPAFSFGQLFYCYRPDAPESAGPVHGWRGVLKDMLRSALHPREEAHLLETFLHATPLEEMHEAATAFVRRWCECERTAVELPALLRSLFNEVSLSPFGDLAIKTLAFLSALEDNETFNTEQVADFLGYLLRHLARHLTAFDLLVFHHRGANYPDALLLDVVLKEYLTLLERRPELFLDGENPVSPLRKSRLRRRALRQGWLLRRRYEGHPVPDLPTSPGENARVLPPSHPRVPEEQIAQPARRTRRLYADDPLLSRLTERLAEVLRQSFVDLEHDEEWRELGLGVFLDRPLGVGKTVAEPDATLLFSAEAFSAAIACERLFALAGDIGVEDHDGFVQRLLTRSAPPGLALDAIADSMRPGTVALADARHAAADFVYLRSTPSSVKVFLAQFDFAPLSERFDIQDLLNGEDVLIARSAGSGNLVIHDARLRPRVELEVATKMGFETRAGQEYPLGGLRVRRVWEPETSGVGARIHELSDLLLSLPARR